MKNTDVQTISFELTLRGLKTLLRQFGVPVETWQKGTSKTPVHFLEELVATDSVLAITNGKLVRQLEVVKLVITSPDRPGKILFETKQNYDGTKRELNRIPAGKIKRDESDLAALIRELREELKLEPGDYDIGKTTRKSSEKNSTSYPGLTTRYRHRFVQVRLLAGSALARKEKFTVTEHAGAKVIRTQFAWVDDNGKYE